MLVDTPLFNWFVLPSLIFLARFVDVSIGTMRIISVSRDMRLLAPILGFLEIMVWLMSIRQIFHHLNNPFYYLAYGAGFASGIYAGMWIERKMAMGLRVVRIITRLDATDLIQALREKGFGVTVADAEGNTGPVKVIYTVIKRAAILEVTAMIASFNPKAFYSIEDVRAASEGNFTNHSSLFSKFLSFEKKR
ncbi:MAG: DUF2179 domain-containing protein [Calditrichaeota bacterium]|nr:MAG: DUF2179 domain-containing protein [Calditrichota bacterium]